MAGHPPFDPRGVANLILDVAAGFGIDVSHVKLQKLLYFAHAVHLIERKGPLVKGQFEAWTHGPVHPAVYQAFKAAGAHKIDFRGEREDILKGTREIVPTPVASDVRMIVSRVVSTLGRMKDFDLVDLSHAEDGPWHEAVGRMDAHRALGARICDDVIVERFARHRLTIEAGPAPRRSGSQSVVEKPLAQNRSNPAYHRTGQ